MIDFRVCFLAGLHIEEEKPGVEHGCGTVSHYQTCLCWTYFSTSSCKTATALVSHVASARYMHVFKFIPYLQYLL
jgi:hypothetical protein